jgi:hypothetical protein
MAGYDGPIDPKALLERALFEGLLVLDAEARPIHAELFIMAAEGGYTLRKAADHLGESEAAVRRALNDLSNLGLIHITLPLDLTSDGNGFLDAALSAVWDVISESDGH